MQKRLLIGLICLCLIPVLGLGDTYYEIFPASFYDSDGDGMGDLAGIEYKLDYLEDLGINGLWLMPIGRSFSYHKYDVVDYMAVDPDYGTVEDFQSLAAASHDKGIRIILDLVVNHTSSYHPWFLSACEALKQGKDSPYIDYYHFTQEAVPGYHEAPDAPGWYYGGVFSPYMPDLNLDNDLVREEILDICAFWLDKGADGFRLDAITHYYGDNTALNTAFLAWLTGSVKELYPDAYFVGEAWQDQATIASLYASGIDSLFNFPFAGATGHLMDCLRNSNGQGFASRLETYSKAIGNVIDAPFVTNHDMARSSGILMKNLEKEKMACAMAMLMPGNTFVYYGEEIGLNGSGADENKRLNMVWSLSDATGQCLPPQGADQKVKVEAGVAEQLPDDGSLLNFYKEAIALKNSVPALQKGQVTALETPYKALCAYQVDSEYGRAYVVHNLSGEELSMPWEYGNLAGALGASGQPGQWENGVLTLKGYSSWVFTQ